MAFETFSVTLDKDKTLIFETGKIARQADGAVLVKMNETWVFRQRAQPLYLRL